MRGWSAGGNRGRCWADRAVLAQGIRRGGVWPVAGLRRADSLDGFVMSRKALDEAEILTIAVTARAQGGGLARVLLQDHMGRLAGLGVRALFLEVDEENAPARKLYERAGFREVGRRKAYYRKPDGSTATALVMRRELG